MKTPKKLWNPAFPLDLQIVLVQTRESALFVQNKNGLLSVAEKKPGNGGFPSNVSLFVVLLSEIDDSQIGLVSLVACQDRSHLFTNFELETPTHQVSEFSNGF